MPSIFYQDPYSLGRAFQSASDTLGQTQQLNRERERFDLLKAKALAETQEQGRIAEQRGAIQDLIALRMTGQVAPEGAGQPNPAQERSQRIREVQARIAASAGSPEEALRMVSRFQEDEAAALQEELKQKAIGMDYRRLQAAARDGLFQDEAILQDYASRLTSPDYRPGSLSQEIGKMRTERVAAKEKERQESETSARIQEMAKLAPDEQTRSKIATIHDLWWENRDEIPYSQVQRQIVDTLFPGASSGGEKSPRDQAIEIAIKEQDLRPERVAEIESFLAQSRALPPIASQGQPREPSPPRPPLSASAFREAQDRKRAEREQRGFVGRTLEGGGAANGTPAAKPWADRPEKARAQGVERLRRGLKQVMGRPEDQRAEHLAALLMSLGIDPAAPLPDEVRAALRGGG